MFTFLGPNSDYVLRTLFSRPEYSDLLQSLLSAVLGPTVEILSAKAVKVELIFSEEDRSGTLNAEVLMQNNLSTFVEINFDRINFERQWDIYLKQRIQLAVRWRGEEYTKIKPTIGINFLSAKDTSSKEFYFIFNGKTDKIEHVRAPDFVFHCIQLPNLKSYLETHPSKINEPLVQWSRFFAAKELSEILALANEAPIFQRAILGLIALSAEKGIQNYVRGRHEYIMDLCSEYAENVRIGAKRVQDRAEIIDIGALRVCFLDRFPDLSEEAKRDMVHLTVEQVDILWDHFFDYPDQEFLEGTIQIYTEKQKARYLYLLQKMESEKAQEEESNDVCSDADN